MTYEDWRESERARLTNLTMEEVSLVDAVTEELGPIDFIFALLGIVTAFRLGTGGSEEEG